MANAAIRGTSAAETLNGTGDADTLDGLGGNDTLNGNGGSDTYLHRAGSGNDIVSDFGSSVDTDTLRLIGVGASDVSLTRSGSFDLIVQRGDTGEAITLQYQYLSPNYGIERVLFDDGTSWDRSYIMTNAAIRGTSAAETLNGTGDADTLDGLGGNDTLQGNSGSDTYLHRAGSGNDIIYDYDFGSSSDVDALRLLGVSPSSVTLSRTSDDLVVTRSDSGEAITVRYQFLSSNYGIERVLFDDGTSWDRTYLADHLNTNHAPTDATLSGGSAAKFGERDRGGNNNRRRFGCGRDPELFADQQCRWPLCDQRDDWRADGRYRRLLNYESAASHGVAVRVTDQGGLTVDKSFTMNVTNVNEAPTNATLSGGSVAENAANGAVVGTVAGVDPDAGATLVYSLTDSAGGRFAINAASGQITVANGSLLDYETAASHGIAVRVTDQGWLTFDKAFTVSVTDVNEAPTNASLSGGSVAENSANGTVVGTVAASIRMQGRR